MTGILIITSMSTLALVLCSVFFTQHLIVTTYLGIIISVIEIILGFLLVYHKNFELGKSSLVKECEYACFKYLP